MTSPKGKICIRSKNTTLKTSLGQRLNKNQTQGRKSHFTASSTQTPHPLRLHPIQFKQPWVPTLSLWPVESLYRTKSKHLTTAQRITTHGEGQGTFLFVDPLPFPCYASLLLRQLSAHPGESGEDYLTQTCLLLLALGYHPPNIHNAHRVSLQKLRRILVLDNDEGHGEDHALGKC